MRYAITVIATLAVTTASNAADLVIEAEPVYIAPAPTLTWEGPYIGVHGGWAWGTETDNQSDILLPDPVEPGLVADEIDLDGWLVGAHAGANMQWDSFVLGLEGVVDLTDVSGTADYDYDGLTGTLGFQNNWQASLNVRAGFAAEALLFYGSVGIAAADGTLTDTPTEGTATSDDNTHVGWTVAAGVEYKFDPSWSARLEARYSDFGDADYDLGYETGNVTSSFTQTAVTFGLSYHF